MIQNGLKKGLHECAKALDHRFVILCCLAKDYENKGYKKFIRALCTEGEFNVIMVDIGNYLGALIINILIIQIITLKINSPSITLYKLRDTLNLTCHHFIIVPLYRMTLISSSIYSFNSIHLRSFHLSSIILHFIYRAASLVQFGIINSFSEQRA